MIKPQYNESLPMEIFYDFQGTQILRINTTDVDVFLSSGKTFDQELTNHIDDKGRIKCIYIIDKVPPLSAVLSFVQLPFAQGVKWSAYAVVMPKDTSIVSKFIPIVTYGLMFTPIKDKYSLKTFKHNFKEDLTDVLDWLNKVAKDNSNEIDVSEGQFS